MKLSQITEARYYQSPPVATADLPVFFDKDYLDPNEDAEYIIWLIKHKDVIDQQFQRTLIDFKDNGTDWLDWLEENNLGWKVRDIVGDTPFWEQLGDDFIHYLELQNLI